MKVVLQLSPLGKPHVSVQTPGSDVAQERWKISESSANRQSIARSAVALPAAQARGWPVSPAAFGAVNVVVMAMDVLAGAESDTTAQKLAGPLARRSATDNDVSALLRFTFAGKPPVY